MPLHCLEYQAFPSPDVSSETEDAAISFGRAGGDSGFFLSYRGKKTHFPVEQGTQKERDHLASCKRVCQRNRIETKPIFSRR